MSIRIRDKKEFLTLMIKKGLTQRGLARAAKVSDTVVCHLINDRRGCGPTAAAKIRSVLDVEFDDIFFIDDADNSKQTGTEG